VVAPQCQVDRSQLEPVENLIESHSRAADDLVKLFQYHFPSVDLNIIKKVVKIVAVKSNNNTVPSNASPAPSMSTAPENSSPSSESNSPFTLCMTPLGFYS
jgi:hypothetical protein